MTTLYVLGSGSSGNALAIACEGEVLLVDAGFSAREITLRAERVGLDLSRVVGLALTHEHGDHTAGAARLARTLHIPVLAAPGTWDRVRRRMPRVEFVPLVLMGAMRHGAFRVEACPTSHDAAQPVALAVMTATGYRVAIAYDLGRATMAVRLLLRQAHAIVLEANDDDVLLRTSGYPPVVQARIAGSGGHLSNRAAAELLADVLHAGLELVVLAHLSERCNTRDVAWAAVAPVLARYGCALHVALQHEALPAMQLRGVGLLL